MLEEELQNIRPCMKSGFCCTLRPCDYGEWNAEHTACAHLLPPNEINQRECGKYQWIKDNVPNWMFYPAFGSGCSSAIGNDLRNNIIKTIVQKKQSGEDISTFIAHLKPKPNA